MEMTAEEKNNIITELDVLWGDDVPWYGFEKLEPPTMEPTGRVQSTHITFRRGVKCKSHLLVTRAILERISSTAQGPSSSLQPRWKVQDTPGCRPTLLCIPWGLQGHPNQTVCGCGQLDQHPSWPHAGY